MNSLTTFTNPLYTPREFLRIISITWANTITRVYTIAWVNTITRVNTITGLTP